MRRVVTAFAIVCFLAAGSTAGAGRTVQTTLHFQVRITQGPTFRHAHPPAGDAGDVFSTTLQIFAMTPEFGKGANAKLGQMTFSYTIHGSCSSAAAGCSGTTNITTVTTFPGGTLVANRTNVPFSKAGFVLPILSGTGKFAGAKGSVAVAPAGQAESNYTITLP